jgi:hypothetical protein
LKACVTEGNVTESQEAKVHFETQARKLHKLIDQALTDIDPISSEYSELQGLNRRAKAGLGLVVASVGSFIERPTDNNVVQLALNSLIDYSMIGKELQTLLFVSDKIYKPTDVILATSKAELSRFNCWRITRKALSSEWKSF